MACQQRMCSFYTEEAGILAGDMTHIAALKVNKLIHMHPRALFDARGVCRRPHMVFCSPQTFADFLVEFLKGMVPP